MTQTTHTVPPTIEVDGLRLAYRSHDTVRTVLHDVSFHVPQGGSLGLIGESGSGKSTIAAAAVGYLPDSAIVQGGAVRIDGEDILSVSPHRLRALRGGTIGLVAQDAASALNPSMRIGAQIVEAIRACRSESSADARTHAVELLRRVRLTDPEGTLRRFPHELSGGQQQRVFIAMVLAARPKVIIFDEPTTGLDASVEAEVLALIDDIRAAEGITSIFISHNLGLVSRLCDEVGVLFEGHLVEHGPTGQVLGTPRHAYTQALIGCIPGPTSDKWSNPVQGISTELLERVRSSIARGEHLAPVDCADIATPDVALATRHQPADEHLRLDGISKRYGSLPVLHDVSLTIRRGQVVGLVGESGSGKSTLARIIAGLTVADAGRITFNGAPLASRVRGRGREVLEAVQMVYQNPDGTLNPRIGVGAALSRAIVKLRGDQTVHGLLESVRLPAEVTTRLPLALSGGQKQRVAIARAIAGHPELVLADEPVSALDTSVQAGVLRLLAALQAEQRVSMLFISHDINVVRYIADHLVVLLHGRIVEQGPAEEVFANPQHPYTRQLLAAAEAGGLHGWSPVEAREANEPVSPAGAA